MRYAILSDIHSNWEALERVIDYLKREKVDEILVLGDNVGYGASPNECFAWAIQSAHAVVIGNHEKAILDPELLKQFNTDARAANEWTAEVLNPIHRKRMEDLRYLHVNLFATLAHGSPDRPDEFRYLFSFQDARESFHRFETALCFVGHTHLPTLFSQEHESAVYLRPGKYELERNGHYILNPGSVGQPRDRDPRLAFGIFDDKKWTFEIVRLDYDNRKAADKIRKVGLPSSLAERLL